MITAKTKGYILRSEEGIGLVEVLAALGIAVVVIVSLVSLALFTLRSSLESKLLLEGTRIANRELELVRAYRDARAWENAANTGFIENVMNCRGVTLCHMDYSVIPLGVSATEGIVNSATPQELRWHFEATKVDGTTQLAETDQEVRISVEVSWMIGANQKFARLYTDLTNWENN